MSDVTTWPQAVAFTAFMALNPLSLLLIILCIAAWRK